MTKKILNKFIGIDLGTTNSCVALYEGNIPKVIENSEGQRTTPSVVSFKPEGNYLVGSPAKRRALTDPENTIISNKRHMGEEGFKGYNIRGKKVTPQEVSAIVLGYMKEIAEERLCEADQEIKRAVITVPAYFDDMQRTATEDAAIIAGLGEQIKEGDSEEEKKRKKSMLRIINEPTAAALAYGLDKDLKDEKVLVYDLGGGTFDVSILELTKDGVISVLVTEGDGNLGGDDYDQRIVDFIIDKFEKEQKVNLAKQSDKMTLQRIYEVAERTKHSLSNEKVTQISEPFITAVNRDGKNTPLNLEMTISRAEFEQMTEDLTNRTFEKVREALRKKNLNSEDIDKVILVGGSTRMPIIAKMIKEKLGKEPNKSINPDEAVAIGAAIQGAILSGGLKDKDILLVDVTPLSLGIETENGIFAKLIEANTAIPTKRDQIFSTATDNQSSVDIKVFQGERARAKDNKFLGHFQLDGIKPASRGVPQIKVTFDINASGIVTIFAEDVTDPKNIRKQSITVQGRGSLSEEEKSRMVKEGKEYRDADKKWKEGVENLQEAVTTLNSFEKELETLRKQKEFNEEDPQFKEFKKLFDDLKKVVEERDHPGIKKQLAKIADMYKILSDIKQRMPDKTAEAKSSSEPKESDNKETDKKPEVDKPDRAGEDSDSDDDDDAREKI